MQWHKAKVSIFLQSGKSLEEKKILKGGIDFKLKKWGGDEETNPKHKFKS